MRRTTGDTDTTGAMNDRRTTDTGATDTGDTYDNRYWSYERQTLEPYRATSDSNRYWSHRTRQQIH